MIPINNKKKYTWPTKYILNNDLYLVTSSDPISLIKSLPTNILSDGKDYNVVIRRFRSHSYMNNYY